MPNSPKGDRNIRKLERKECTVKASPRAGRSKKPLEFRQRLQSSNRHAKHVYFLESDLGLVAAIGGQRRQAEIAIIGREGMTGLPVVHGADRSPCDVFMQVEGNGQRISADNLRASMVQSIALLRCFLGFGARLCRAIRTYRACQC
jgi:hypothetical protein